MLKSLLHYVRQGEMSTAAVIGHTAAVIGHWMNRLERYTQHMSATAAIDCRINQLEQLETLTLTVRNEAKREAENWTQHIEKVNATNPQEHIWCIENCVIKLKTFRRTTVQYVKKAETCMAEIEKIAELEGLEGLQYSIAKAAEKLIKFLQLADEVKSTVDPIIATQNRDGTCLPYLVDLQKIDVTTAHIYRRATTAEQVNNSAPVTEENIPPSLTIIIG
jgi:hypothetical protein